MRWLKCGFFDGEEEELDMFDNYLVATGIRGINRYKKKWSEQLPNKEKIFINGKTYVHWYACITDYIF